MIFRMIPSTIIMWILGILPTDRKRSDIKKLFMGIVE